MATTLLKLSVTASQPTTTAKPDVTRFFHTVPAGGYTGAATYTIADASWIDDSGATVGAGGLVPVTANNGFYELFINGQLQEGDILAVTTTDVTLTFGGNTDIAAGKIIALAVTNFTPETSAPTITV